MIKLKWPWSRCLSLHIIQTDKDIQGFILTPRRGWVLRPLLDAAAADAAAAEDA